MSDPCEEALHELYHFLDGELTDSRRQLISTHLDGCSTCLGAFDFEVELRHVVAQRCRDTVPDALRERIAQAIGHEPHGEASA
jgi:mycothiol system anti-sigma-R factor